MEVRDVGVSAAWMPQRSPQGRVHGDSNIMNLDQRLIRIKEQQKTPIAFTTGVSVGSE